MNGLGSRYYPTVTVKPRPGKRVCILTLHMGIFLLNFLAALALEALHKQVLPFLLRRLKEDVLNDLPPKIIQDYYCELSEVQKRLYDEFSKSPAKKNVDSAVQAEEPAKEGGKGQQHVFQSLQYLRKLCNHPALVLKDPDAISAALAKVSGSASKSLDDIQHAPKLLALR